MKEAQMNIGNEATRAFLDARDFLLRHRCDYETAAREFRWPQLRTFNWALDYFDVFAHGNRQLALRIVEENGDERALSYEDLARRSNQVANFLRACGVRRGDRILMMLPNHVALWEIVLAGIKLGAVIVPSTVLLSPEDLADRMDRAEVRFVVAMAADASRFANYEQVAKISVDGAPPDWVSYQRSLDASENFDVDGVTHADDPLLLYFTSGTTSKPRLVIHSHRSYPVGHLSTMYWIGLQAGDIHYNISSPGWAKHAWSCFFAPFNAGAAVFVYNYNRFNAPAVLSALVRYGVTTFCAPPTVWRMLVQENLGVYPVRLRELIGAGEPLNPQIIERVQRAWGISIRDGFGQTEITAAIGNSVAQPLKPGSMGRPLPGYRIALLDSDGHPAAEGEISISLDPPPASMMLGYYRDGETQPAAGPDGYYRTGDVAVRDADGYYTYVGRTDDVFKSSDYRISPFELESALIEHEAVAEAAVVPSPDALRLSVPKAFISLRQGYQPTAELAASIFSFTRRSLAPYKRLRRLEFRDLPKTISGKIRRVELRREEQARPEQRSPLEFWEQDFADPR
jgi:acetyl-CoA synthetase